jgi:hypothetical protein
MGKTFREAKNRFFDEDEDRPRSKSKKELGVERRNRKVRHEMKVMDGVRLDPSINVDRDDSD